MGMRLRIYIAGPMTGLANFDYHTFENTRERLNLLGYGALSPTDSEYENIDGPRYGKPKEWYMKRALQMVLSADGVALLPGWENSEGVRVELEVALALGLDIRPINMWQGEET